jgi:hypothetical protein
MDRSELFTAIFKRLAGGTALVNDLGGTFIYFQLAPDKKALPYVVVDFTARNSENDTSHKAVNSIAYIRAYASTPVQASAIDAKVDTLMDDKPLTITGVSSNFWLRRDAGIDPPPEVDQSGRKVYACGAEYRIRFEI